MLLPKVNPVDKHCMRLFDVLQPVFAYAAHIKPAAPGQGAPADAVKHLATLLAKARAQRSAFRPDSFDRAWLALCAWLGETVDADCVASQFPGIDRAEEFFATLDALLPEEGEPADADADVLRAYVLALDLGFAGRRDEPRPPEQIECRRQRCRRAARRLDRRNRAAAPPPQPKPPSVYARAGTLLCWIVPVAVTVLLYSVYRLLLAGLYSEVVG